MTISFTGIQNVAGIATDLNNATRKRVVVQLNNIISPDLDNYQDVFKKFKDPMKLGFLRIESEVDNSGKRVLRINDELLQAKDENLPVFSKIAKLLSTITENKKGFKTCRDYLENDDSSINLFGRAIRNRTYYQQKIIDKAHDTEVSRYKSYEINKDIQKTMAKYFNFNYNEVRLKEFD